LLPGDIISLAAIGASREENEEGKESEETKPSTKPKRKQPTQSIPADCLMLSGSAIVNEASLTGESVPQMKEGISAVASDATTSTAPRLDIDGVHRIHTLFSGTQIVAVEGVSHSFRNLLTEEVSDV